MRNDIYKVAELVDTWRRLFGSKVPIVATSGGFDPIHVGHLRCIQESASFKENNGLLIVIVNGDSFLERKKGRAFMPLNERLELVEGLRGVDHTVAWESDEDTVSGAIEIIRPSIFTKGGDRSDSATVPEFEICKAMGCEVRFGVGGYTKVQSSSVLISKVNAP